MKKYFFILLSINFFIISCNEKSSSELPKEISKEDLLGKWSIYKYDGLIKVISFEFTEDSVIKSSYKDGVFNSSTKYSYYLSNDNLKLKSSPFIHLGDTIKGESEFNYKIQSQSKDSLSLLLEYEGSYSLLEFINENSFDSTSAYK